MTRANRRLATRTIFAVLALGAIFTLSTLMVGWTQRSKEGSGATYAGRRPTGYPQLVSVQPLPEPEVEGEMCEWMPASSPARLAAALQQERFAGRAASAPAADTRNAVVLERPPVRVIQDPYPTYSAVAVDPKNNEIVLQDENLFQLMVYDRMTNTPPTAKMSEPKRVIGGHETNMEFNCAIYIDPKTGDLYSVNNDTLDTMTVFTRNQKGNVHPARELKTPHRTYGIAVDEANEELFLTVQHPPMVVVYNKYAKGTDKPVRVLRGNRVGLGDPHGIGVDTKNGLMIVANYGNKAEFSDGGGNALPGRGDEGIVAGSGKYFPPSISVYPIKASGDTSPLRVIEGPNTQLNWPAHIYVDEANGEIFIANDGTDSILVFRVTDSGNVAPTRVLKGPKTQIKNPTGVYVDSINNEVVVANMGNHRATVYPRNAQGDTPPTRTIRAAAEGTPALQIGNPGAVAYDTKRDEILVPN